MSLPAHLTCLQNSAPCSCRTAVPFPCWLSYGIYSLLLEAIHFLLGCPLLLQGQQQRLECFLGFRSLWCLILPPVWGIAVLYRVHIIRLGPLGKSLCATVIWLVTLVTFAKSLLLCYKRNARKLRSQGPSRILLGMKIPAMLYRIVKLLHT